MGGFLKVDRILRLGREQDGASTVEFALLLIPLVLLIAGFIDYADAFCTKQVMTNASRAGARFGVRFILDSKTGNRTAPDANSIQQFVQSNYGTEVIVTTTGTGLTSNKSGDPLSVTVTKNKDWIFNNFLSSYVGTLPPQIANTTTMTLE